MDVALDELGVERNWGEWVLDLVSDAARDLLPRRLLLRAKQLGDIFEDEHVAEVLPPQGVNSLATPFMGVGAGAFEESDSGGDLQRAGGGRHLHFARGGAHAVRAAQEPGESVDNLGGKSFM